MNAKRPIESELLDLLQSYEDTQKSEGDSGKNLAAVLLGRKGGLKGGRARALSMSSERRSEIAKLAANKRWAKTESNHD